MLPWLWQTLAEELENDVLFTVEKDHAVTEVCSLLLFLVSSALSQAQDSH